MPYQVNMTTNSGDGFTDDQLLLSLKDCVAGEAPDLEVRQADNEALELTLNGRTLATVCPAGREPYDYLLVDFTESHGWDDGPSIRVMTRLGELLDLSILELESRLEYTPQQWAASRGRHHAPDPARAAEARHLALDSEIEFYERLGIPYSAAEIDTLREAAAQPAESQAALEIRERKKREPRPAEVNRDLAPAPPPPAWWPFGKRKK